MEGKLALFQMPAAGGGGGVDICLRVGSPPIGKKKEGAPCRNSAVSSDVIFRSVIGGLSSIRPCLFDAQLIFSSGLPRGLSGKESACHAEDPGSISGSGRSLEEGMATHCSIRA